MKTVKTYIDARENRKFDKLEVLGLLTGELTPYPDGWYSTEEFVTEYKNSSFLNEWDNLDHNDELDYSEYTCPVNKYEYLVCYI
jgi:hypothetical protein